MNRARATLALFMADVFSSVPRKDQRSKGDCCLRGLMLDGRRKSIQPIAERLRGLIAYRADPGPAECRALVADPDPEVRTKVARRADLGPTERRVLTTDSPSSPTTRTLRSGLWPDAAPKPSRQPWSDSPGTRPLP